MPILKEVKMILDDIKRTMIKEHGMGMGLSIPRTTVKVHGGKISSNNDAGDAVFRMKLPPAKA